MAFTNAERQARWKNRQVKLARIAMVLQQHDAELFKRLHKVAEKWTKQRARKRKAHAA